jgi:arginine decarboxylase
MEIEVVWGTAEARTGLSAFDAALAEAGLHNYNLVTLSSVVPGGATVVETGRHERRWPVGSMVGVVLAETRSTVEGATIHAGLAWAHADQGGVFYEAGGESEGNVERLLRRGIRSAKEIRPEWDWEDGTTVRLASHTVEHTGAAVVAATYEPLETGVTDALAAESAPR